MSTLAWTTLFTPLLALAFLPSPLEAGPSDWIFTQITDTSGHCFRPALSADGYHIAFSSNEDHVGQNADRNFEIFLYNGRTGILQQVTNSTTPVPHLGSADAGISGDGKRVVFHSNADLLGLNPDLSTEVFLYDVDSEHLQQLTSGAEYQNSYEPDLSVDGSWVGFRSPLDLTGENPDSSDEIFLFEIASGDFTQVTHTQPGDGGCSQPELSFSAQTVAFLSTANLTGLNPDRNREVFLYERVTEDLQQITHTLPGTTNLNNNYPDIDSAGSVIAFESDRNIENLNPDLNRELLLFDRQNDVFHAGTSSTFDNRDVAAPPAIAQGGGQAVTSQEADLVGTNPDHSFEIFLYDLASDSTSQVTDSPLYDSFSPSISSDGSRIAFKSDGDFTGRNGDHTGEIFVATRRAAQFLTTPLAGDPRISRRSVGAVLDHHVPTGYNCFSQGACTDPLDGSLQVRGFHGEEGRSIYGQNCPPPGYRNSSGTPFTFGGQIAYEGVSCTGGTPDPAYLNYDGHSGYDFLYPAGWPLRAAAAGVLEVPTEDPINNPGGSSSAPQLAYNSLRIIHDNGFETWYLHSLVGSECAVFQTCPARPEPGAQVPVVTGQHIAAVGATGASGPHLHFEVRRTSEPTEVIDPFGCSDLVASRHLAACVGRLWVTVVFTDGFETGDLLEWSVVVP